MAKVNLDLVERREKVYLSVIDYYKTTVTEVILIAEQLAAMTTPPNSDILAKLVTDLDVIAAQVDSGAQALLNGRSALPFSG